MPRTAINLLPFTAHSQSHKVTEPARESSCPTWSIVFKIFFPPTGTDLGHSGQQHSPSPAFTVKIFDRVGLFLSFLSASLLPARAVQDNKRRKLSKRTKGCSKDRRCEFEEEVRRNEESFFSRAKKQNQHKIGSILLDSSTVINAIARAARI